MINHPCSSFVRRPEYERFIRIQADGDSPLKYTIPSLDHRHGSCARRSSARVSWCASRTRSYAQLLQHGGLRPRVDAQSKKQPYRIVHAMKYSAKSCTPPDQRGTDTRDDDYLGGGWRPPRRIGCLLRFPRAGAGSDDDMPIEDPTVRWM